MLDFLRGLSFGSRYFRFGSGGRNFTEAELRRVCNPDPAEVVHFVVVHHAAEGDQVVGSARIALENDGASCELGVVVGDRWQARGIGKVLVEALIAAAKGRGLKEMHANIQATNRPMVRFATELGFRVGDSSQGAGIKRAALQLA